MEAGTSVAPVFLKRSLHIQLGKAGQTTSFPEISASAVAVEPNEISASQIRVSSQMSDFCEINITFLFFPAKEHVSCTFSYSFACNQFSVKTLDNTEVTQ